MKRTSKRHFCAIQEPIFSLDFNPVTGLLATAGADKYVRFWSIEWVERESELDEEARSEGSDPTKFKVTHLQSAAEHTAAVNALRFSPDGHRLITGADTGELFLWRDTSSIQHTTSSRDEACQWEKKASLIGHQDDLQDVAWSPDGTALATAAVDNTSIVWDMSSSLRANSSSGGENKCMPIGRLPGHEHWVQGVTWDPLGEHIATMSGDRCCRIYGSANPRDVRKPLKDQLHDMHSYSTIKHADIPVQDRFDEQDDDCSSSHKGKSKRSALFLDDTLPSFFRRLDWSPDGSFLAVPAGVYKHPSASAHQNVTQVFKRNHWNKPALQVPALYAPTVAVRFCPVLFKKGTGCIQRHKKQQIDEDDENAADKNNEQPMFDLPYRIVFAVATTASVIVYDTDEAAPLCICGELHLASITDLAWSSDGTYLAVASSDGFVSIIGFHEDDLGVRVEPEEYPEDLLQRLQALHLSQTI